MTLDQMAELIDVSPSTLLRTEQGLYVDIPPKILRFLDANSIRPWDIRSEYVRYQVGQRTSVLEQFYTEQYGRRLPRLSALRYKEGTAEVFPKHPLARWYTEAGFKSRLDFCKGLCLHPSSIIRFEKGKTVDIPEQLALVMWELDLRPELHTLKQEYPKWRNALYSRRLIKEVA